MKKTFLVKKNPDLPGTDNNWIIMKGFEFARFMETEEGQKRKSCFERIGSVDDEAGVLYMECSREKLPELWKERNHEDYLRK